VEIEITRGRSNGKGIYDYDGLRAAEAMWRLEMQPHVFYMFVGNNGMRLASQRSMRCRVAVTLESHASEQAYCRAVPGQVHLYERRRTSEGENSERTCIDLRHAQP
jgi:hypothetical protein